MTISTRCKYGKKNPLYLFLMDIECSIIILSTLIPIIYPLDYPDNIKRRKSCIEKDGKDLD